LAAGGDRVVRTVEDVIDRMREIGSGLPRRDGIAEFNRVYLQVSELVRDRLRDGFFRDARFTERLGVVFAGLYYDDAGLLMTEFLNGDRSWLRAVPL